MCGNSDARHANCSARAPHADRIAHRPGPAPPTPRAPTAPPTAQGPHRRRPSRPHHRRAGRPHLSGGDERGTSPRPDRSPHVIDANDVRLNVFDTGVGQPAVVMLHGLGGHSLEWTTVAAQLRASRRLVAFDQRGHAGSTRRPADLTRDAYVRDVITVLHHLDLDRVTLVGQSMGADTALLTAARYPERISRLVLVEGGSAEAGPDATDDVIDWFESWPTPFPDHATALSYFQDQYGPGPGAEAWAAGLEPTPQGLAPRFDTDVLRTAIDAVHTTNSWNEWDAISCPTTIIRGEHGFMSAEEAADMVRQNPHAIQTTIPGAGHDVHLEAPHTVAQFL